MTCWTYLSLITVEPVIFLYMLSIFLEYSVIQDLISTKVCISLTDVNDTDLCRGLLNSTFLEELKNDKTYRDEKTSWVQYHSAILAVLNLISSCYIGSWSDKFGRKVAMFIPPIGSILSTVNMLVVSSYMHSKLSYILISSVFSGISGGTVAIIANCFGYISGITSELTRSKRIAVAESMLIIGGTVGMYIGGAALKPMGYFSVFLIEMCLLIFVVLYIAFFVKEINCPVARDALTEEKGTCMKLFGARHIVDMVKTVFCKRENSKRGYILLLLVATIMIYYGLAVQIDVLYIYVTNKPLNWDQQLYSYFYGVNFALSGIALICLPFALRWLNISDTLIAIVGVSSRMAGLIFLGLAKSTAVIFICIFPDAIDSGNNPTSQDFRLFPKLLHQERYLQSGIFPDAIDSGNNSTSQDFRLFPKLLHQERYLQSGPVVFIFSEYPLPAIRSMLSKWVNADERGKIFAFMASLQNFAFLSGAMMFRSLLLHVASYVCFELVAGLQVIALLILIFLHVSLKRNNQYLVMSEGNNTVCEDSSEVGSVTI